MHSRRWQTPRMHHAGARPSGPSVYFRQSLAEFVAALPRRSAEAADIHRRASAHRQQSSALLRPARSDRAAAGPGSFMRRSNSRAPLSLNSTSPGIGKPPGPTAPRSTIHERFRRMAHFHGGPADRALSSDGCRPPRSFSTTIRTLRLFKKSGREGRGSRLSTGVSCEACGWRVRELLAEFGRAPPLPSCRRW